MSVDDGKTLEPEVELGFGSESLQYLQESIEQEVVRLVSSGHVEITTRSTVDAILATEGWSEVASDKSRFFARREGDAMCLASVNALGIVSEGIIHPPVHTQLDEILK